MSFEGQEGLKLIRIKETKQVTEVFASDVHGKGHGAIPEYHL